MTRTNRRQFLSAAAATLAVPTIFPRSVFGANERIVTGHVGVGGQGMSNLKGFLNLASPAAVCDVDSKRLAGAAKLLELGGVSRPFAARDYREILDRKDVDAVVVTTPDHWHALATVHACQAGKDVYCEKPLSLTVAEGRKMVDAARKADRVVQTGSQQRSDARFKLAVELVRAGRLGQLKTVLVGIPDVNFASPAVPDSDPPPELDYDTWLGPAPRKPYNAKHVHYNFRFFWDYSGGQMTNFGAHDLDITQTALDADGAGPIAVEGEATYDPKHEYEVTKTCRITYTYPGGVTVLLGQGQKDVPKGITFVGEKGTIFVSRQKIVGNPADLATDPYPAGGKAKNPDMSRAHHQNFLDCVKSRKRPAADVEIGHRSATVCHLGNIAVRLGRKFGWDPASEKVTGDDQAQAMLSRPYRSPWTL